MNTAGSATRIFRLALCLAATLMSGAALAQTAPSGPAARQLLQAVRQHRIDVVRRMAGSGVDVDTAVPGDGTALIVAARRGDLAMVDALLELGADANVAVRGDGDPLIAAASAGHVDVMKVLVRAGARLDAVVVDDETALIAAVRNDRRAAVEYLVGHGADVNLGVLADGARWRSPLNQARSPALRRYLADRGAVSGGPG